MNHRVWVLGVVLLGLVGCQSTQVRGQSADKDDRDKDLDVKTIGQVTDVGTPQPTQVSGVGLVTGLNGTGGVPPGGYRLMLEKQLHQQKVENVKEILASPDVALVLVTALIPAGAHKSDPLDVTVTLPPDSKATSLRGGYLQQCFLRNYDTKKNLSP